MREAGFVSNASQWTFVTCCSSQIAAGHICDESTVITKGGGRQVAWLCILVRVLGGQRLILDVRVGGGRGHTSRAGPGVHVRGDADVWRQPSVI